MPLQALQLVLPKKKGKAGGTSSTPTFRPGVDKLALPAYRDHLTDLFSTRQANDSRTLMSDLARHDSDVSAAFFAYQTISGSAPFTVKAYDMQQQVAPDGIGIANQILERLTTVTDYSLGFSAKPSLGQLNDDMRYWTLLRGTPGAELILDKKLEPDTLRLIDMKSIEWHEANVGVYKPIQRANNQIIDLDVPTFFTARFNQNPSDIYSYSPFVAAINTIATRQEVINELYRITQVIGYPRMDVTVLEEVLLKSAPPLLRTDAKATRQFVDNQIAQIRASFQNMRADETLVHTDAVEVDMVNDSRPGSSLPIQNVIDILDNQNLAALKTMPAVIGKSNNGQVASTEARLFALNCDALNRVVADVWSQVLTLAARLAGFQGRIVFEFEPVELRPVLELEPQKTMKQSRLEQALSRGYITDDEFHIDVFGRPRPASAPQLSGTNFAQPTPAASVDPSQQSPNGDSLGRGMTGGNKNSHQQVKDNNVKSKAGKAAPTGKPPGA